MMDERRLAEAIMSRMPSSRILQTMSQTRARGVSWDQMQEIAKEAGADAEPEGKRYYQRGLIATYALECEGMNN